MTTEIKHVKGQDGKWHKIGPGDRDYFDFNDMRVPVGYALTTKQIKEIIAELKLAIKEVV